MFEADSTEVMQSDHSPIPTTEPTPIRNWKAIAVIVCLSIGFLAIIGLSWLLYVTKSDVNDLEASLEDLREKTTSEFTTMNSRITDLGVKADKASELDDKVQGLSRMNFSLYIAHELEDGVVTDDFVLEKFSITDYDHLEIILDVNNQPDMSLHYKGKGAYDLTDRELRAKIDELVEEVKDFYEKLSNNVMPVWDDKAVVTVTVKNYELATVTNGNVALVGEK